MSSRISPRCGRRPDERYRGGDQEQAAADGLVPEHPREEGPLRQREAMEERLPVIAGWRGHRAY